MAIPYSEESERDYEQEFEEFSKTPEFEKYLEEYYRGQDILCALDDSSNIKPKKKGRTMIFGELEPEVSKLYIKQSLQNMENYMKVLEADRERRTNMKSPGVSIIEKEFCSSEDIPIVPAKSVNCADGKCLCSWGIPHPVGTLADYGISTKKVKEPEKVISKKIILKVCCLLVVSLGVVFILSRKD